MFSIFEVWRSSPNTCSVCGRNHVLVRPLLPSGSCVVDSSQAQGQSVQAFEMVDRSLDCGKLAHRTKTSLGGQGKATRYGEGRLLRTQENCAEFWETATAVVGPETA